jgi:hypothetical protein
MINYRALLWCLHQNTVLVRGACRLSNNGEVYVYQERESRSLFVCKFFGSRWYLSEQERKDGLNYEFKNLSTVCDMGFCKFPYHVVRPLSMDERLNCLLVEDFVRGHHMLIRFT